MRNRSYPFFAVNFLIIFSILLLTACGQKAAQAPAEQPAAAPRAVEKTVEVEMAAGAPAPAAPGLTETQQAIASRLDTYFSNLNSQGQFSGTALINTDGVTLLEKAYGMADRAQSLQNLPATRFRIDHIAMQLTALAAYTLISQGRLSLDTPVCDYLDTCPQEWLSFTIRDLLYNTTTLPDYSYITDVLKQNVSQPISVDELIVRLQTLPVAEAPVQGQWVGDANYIILGAVIEELTGMKFNRFLAENLLNPLQMDATGLAQGSGENEDVAVQYRGPGQTDLATPIDLSNLFTGGGMYSNVYDLIKFLNAFTSEQFLPRDMLNALLQPDPEKGYGYGWMAYQHEGQPMLTTTFTQGDLYGSLLAMTPDGKTQVIILVNQDLAPLGSLDTVLDILAGK